MKVRKSDGRKHRTFSNTLLRWNRESNQRMMPWKGEKDAYRVWLSEIILQQTRVEQGIPYYKAFLQRFPDVSTLAKAKPDEVMKLWQGLGYYSRARNLHETAQNIFQNFGGKFPASFSDLKKLKGIGDYTAAAIASFVFGEPTAVVDGNVIRILARYFGIKQPFDNTAGKKKFALLAQELIDVLHPGEYNQAIMDFGATVCMPKNPQCSTCPLRKNCYAYRNHKTSSLPNREKKIKITDRYFNYLLVKKASSIYICKREGNDIWKGLYELPLIESSKPLPVRPHTAIAAYLKSTDFEILKESRTFSQLLSHRRIHFQFYEIKWKPGAVFPKKEWIKIRLRDLPKFAFPKKIQTFLEEIL